MMLGKIIDGNLTYPPHKIVLLGMQIFNPTEEQLIQDGYKPIIETVMPEDPAPDGWHYEAVYTDGETITQSWVLVEDEAVDPPVNTISQRVADLEENVNGISTAIERGLRHDERSIRKRHSVRQKQTDGGDCRTRR